MEETIDFGSLLSGLQHMPEREKIILMSLIDRQGNSQNGETAKIERYIGQMIVNAAREKLRTTPSQGQVKEEAAPHISLVQSV